MHKSTIGWTIGVIALSGFLVIGFGVIKQKPATEGSATSARTNREVALACTSDMATQFHIHPSLKIEVNGADVTIPADIGIRTSCMNALHTHDMTGLIHIESPEKRDFTLADFFAVWQQPFSQSQVLGNKIDASHHITVTVNGNEVQTFENTIMKDGDKIVISYVKN